MSDRISGTSSSTHSYGVSAFSETPATSQNALLATMAVGHARLSALQAQADAWLVSAQKRAGIARDANEFATLANSLEQRVSAGAKPEVLPQALRDFAIKHELLSAQAASEPLDAVSLRNLESRLKSLGLNDSASSAREQLEIKHVTNSYGAMLTLCNAALEKLGEITKTIVSRM